MAKLCFASKPELHTHCAHYCTRLQVAGALHACTPHATQHLDTTHVFNNSMPGSAVTHCRSRKKLCRLSMATPAVSACRLSSARCPSADMRSFLKCPCFTATANSSRALACRSNAVTGNNTSAPQSRRATDRLLQQPCQITGQLQHSRAAHTAVPRPYATLLAGLQPTARKNCTQSSSHSQSPSINNVWPRT